MENKDLESSQKLDQWINDELNKLSTNSYEGTFFTIVELRHINGQNRNIVVPVQKWFNGDVGFEVISIQSIARQCPWDMELTSLAIDTGVTKINDNLMNLVENRMINDRIDELNRERKDKEIGVYKNITELYSDGSVECVSRGAYI